MNGNTIRNTSLIALGGMLGGMIGYILGELIIEKLIEKDLEKFLENPYGDQEEEEEEVKPEPEKRLKDYTKYAKEELSELVKPYTTSIAEEPKKLTEKIMIISFDDYSEDRSHNKEPITYYENDTTFADAQEDIIDDPNSLFGPNIHLHFGEESEDPDMVFVRNENTGVDYEISRIHNSYSVIVMGMPEEPPKEKAKKRKNVRKVDTHDDDEFEDEEAEG